MRSLFTLLQCKLAPKKTTELAQMAPLLLGLVERPKVVSNLNFLFILSISILGGDADYDDYTDLAPPPDPRAEEPFEQAESSYEEPVYVPENGAQGAGQQYGGPTQQPDYNQQQQPNSLYNSPAREGRTGRRLGGGSRRRQNGGRRRGKHIQL